MSRRPSADTPSASRRRHTAILPSPSASSGPNSTSDASHYFAIETRLELRARLSRLQPILRSLLLQSQLAWLRCWARPADEAVEPAPEARVAAAWQLVTLGEELAAALSRAFAMARATSASAAPLSVYQALVTRVECETATFQQLVAAVAQGTFVSPEDDDECIEGEDSEEGDSEEGDSEEEEEELQPKVVAYPRQPERFDLPSMQSYCARVAPPYSSYLPAPNKR